jgi:hypothetical protein
VGDDVEGPRRQGAEELGDLLWWLQAEVRAGIYEENAHDVARSLGQESDRDGRAIAMPHENERGQLESVDDRPDLRCHGRG